MKRNLNGKGKGQNPAPRSTADAHALKEARVRHIMTLITSGQWVTWVTAEQLSHEPDPELPEGERGWGISIVQIEALASDAAARLRERLASDDITRAATIGALEMIRTLAMQERKWDSAVKAILAINGIQVRGKLGADILDPANGGQHTININNIIRPEAIAAAAKNEAAAAPVVPVVAAPTIEAPVGATGEGSPAA